MRTENPDISDYGHYWDQRGRSKVADPKPPQHYDDDIHHFRSHGFNKTAFEFPLRRDPALQRKIAKRNEDYGAEINSGFGLPSDLIPTFNPDLKCTHGNKFQENNNLKLISKHVTIFAERNEYKMKRNVYGRPSNGDCTCYVQSDCHEYALWHLGNGNMVDYNFLLSSVLGFFTGNSFNAQTQTRNNFLKVASSLDSTMTAKDLYRASTGFIKMMSFTRDDFICPSCGDTPQYIVCDRKQLGPRSIHTKHLSEMGPAEGDEDILEVIRRAE